MKKLLMQSLLAREAQPSGHLPAQNMRRLAVIQRLET
nr:MAG TPA: hypothetical protein [Caudoviricetes sp.]